MSAGRNVTFTRTSRDRLRLAYEVAVVRDDDQFEFDGDEYHTPYAKYLLMYLDRQFGDLS